jgi:hypothetical protein
MGKPKLVDFKFKPGDYVELKANNLGYCTHTLIKIKNVSYPRTYGEEAIYRISFVKDYPDDTSNMYVTMDPAAIYSGDKDFIEEHGRKLTKREIVLLEALYVNP